MATTDRWYAPWIGAMNGTVHSSLTPAKHYWPFFTGKQSIDIDALGFWTNGTASPTAGVWRAAIYASTTWPTDLYPGALIVDSGNITMNASDGLVFATFTAVTLASHTMYWFATKRQTNASGTAVHAATTDKTFPYQPYQTTNTFAAGTTQKLWTPLQDTNVTGAWPDPATAGAAPVNTVPAALIPFFRVTGAA